MPHLLSRPLDHFYPPDRGGCRRERLSKQKGRASRAAERNFLSLEGVVNHCEVGGVLVCGLVVAVGAAGLLPEPAGLVAAPLVLGLVAAGLAGAGTPDCTL